MKKTLSIVLSFIMIISTMAIAPISAFASADSGTCGANVKWELSDDKTSLYVYGNGPMYDWASDYTSTPWYKYRNSINKLIIGTGITHIGDFAFNDLTEIKGVGLTNFIESIGDGAFYGCSSIHYVGFNDGLKTIGFYAFDDCISLKNVTIPSSVTEIGGSAFADCTALSNVVLNYGLQRIGTRVFRFTNIDSIAIPCSVTDIGFDAFDYKTKVYYNGTAYDGKGNSFGAGELLPNTTEYGHNFTSRVFPGVSATCTKPGKTVVMKCSKCSTTAGGKDIPMVPHTYSVTVTPRIDATCTVAGITAVMKCENCTATVGGTAIPATGHTYSVTVTPRIDATCTVAGTTAVMKCENCTATVGGELIPATGHIYKTTTTKATTSADGKVVSKCVCGDVKSTSAIYYPKTATLSAASYTYDGKAKKPTVTVKDSNGKAIASSNYTVAYSNNKSVGTATVKITFKGNYSGTVSKTFTINPKATSISSLSAVSKGFTAKWKKQATQTTGYEIQYAIDSKFKKNAKTVTVSKNSTVSKKITKLTAKKKYYVRIRTYKTVSGKKYYSSWSGSKSVTTKK